MTRINNRILVQEVDENHIVIRDDAANQEVVIPRDHLGRLMEAVAYFAITVKQDRTQERSR